MVSLVLCTAWLLYISIRFREPGTLTSALPFYLVMFVIGLGRGFYAPAQFSLMTQLIPREAYANSSAWNSTFWHIAVVVGSSAGGLLLAALGKTVSYSMVLACILISLVQMLRIKAPKFERIAHTEPALESIRTGLRFVFQNKIILGALSLDLVAVLFGGATACFLYLPATFFTWAKKDSAFSAPPRLPVQSSWPCT
jgi:MFS family permease